MAGAALAKLRGCIAWAAIAAWQCAEGAIAPEWAFLPSRKGSLRMLTEVDPLAVCVDGSPAGYYWQEGEKDSSMWIIDMQGGGWCYDEASCAKRCPKDTEAPHCSSKGYKHEVELGAGLLSPETHSALALAHRVWLPYCTSDAHMGDAEAFNGMQFRGARVLRATVTDLIAQAGLGGLGRGAGRPVVILSGQSAGGRGAMVNLDYVRGMLGGMLTQRVDVLGILDSPLWIDVAPFTSHFVGFAAECQGVFSFANVTNLDTACQEAHPGDEGWKCIMGQYRLPFLRTPYLLIASQYDAFQLTENHIRIPLSAAEAKYADNLASRTRAVMETLRAGWQAKDWWSVQNAVFSWTCHDHATSTTERGFDKRFCGPNGTTMDSAALEFLGLRPADGYPSPLEWLDNCTGINCGAGCIASDLARGNGMHGLLQMPQALPSYVLKFGGKFRKCRDTFEGPKSSRIFKKITEQECAMKCDTEEKCNWFNHRVLTSGKSMPGTCRLSTECKRRKKSKKSKNWLAYKMTR